MSENICCTCFGDIIKNSSPCTEIVPPGKVPKCMSLGHITADQCDQKVGPCDQEVKIPFDCFDFPCDEPVFKIVKESEYADILSIDKTGITIKTNGTGKAYDKVYIEFYAVCKIDDCHVYSDYGSISLYISDMCNGVLCGDNEVCNECNGNCEAVVVDLEITKDASTFIGDSGLLVGN